MTDCTNPDSERIITSGDVLRELHAEIETLTLYKNLADEYGLSIFSDIAEMTAELETLRAQLKTNEDLGDARSDMQLLRMGYAAARLEIESLNARPAGALQPSPAAQGDALDTLRLDWLDADEGRCVFHFGKSWYTRPSYGLPYRKRASLREAIDAARAAQEGNKL